MTGKCILLAVPSLLGFSAPAFGQANPTGLCPAEAIAAETDEEGNYVGPHCYSIVVTGNLRTFSGEQTENIFLLPKNSAQGDIARLEERLATVPGVQQFRRSDARSANPTSQGVTLRGLGGNASSRALLFLDDVPQADPFGGWVSWPAYDGLNLASVRIRKGGGHVASGVGAIAGVIELDSLQNQDDHGQVLFGYGSRNSLEARGRALIGIGQGSVSISGSYSNGDGFIPIIKSQRGRVDRAAPYEQASAALRLVAPLTGDIELQANMRGFTDQRDRGVDFSANRNDGVDASMRIIGNGYSSQWSLTTYVQLRDFSSQFGAVSADRSTVTPTLDQFAVPSTGLGMRFEWRPSDRDLVGGRVQLRLGGEWRRTIGETHENFTFITGIPTRFRKAGGRIDSYGAFAEASYQPDYQMTLTAGGRLDRWKIVDGFRREVNIGGTVRSDDRFVDRQGTEFTGRIAGVTEFADNFRLKASAYTAWRLPTLNELYRPFRVGVDATAANEALKPERIKGIEAGLSFEKGSPRQANLTAFFNRLDGAIANVGLGQGAGIFPGVGFVAAGGVYRQRQNLKAIISKGVELDGRFRIFDGLDLNFGYAFVDSKVKATGIAVALDGLQPAQVPKHFANLGLDITHKDAKTGSYANWDASFNLRYVGNQFEDDANTRRQNEALTADAMVQYRFGNNSVVDGLTVQLRGENLFNKRVEAAISSSGIIERANPRTLWLGASWNFD
jgi:vitamin B12 transporter